MTERIKTKKKIGSLLLVFALILGCFLGLTGCKQDCESRTRYEITAEYLPETRTLAGTVKVTFEYGGEGVVSLLKFQLYPNAYRRGALYKPVSVYDSETAYYDGESYGEMVISSVHGARSWSIAGEDENILYVYLPESLYQGDKVVLDIGFLTKLARVNHRTGETKRVVNLGNFYPALCGVKDGGFYETVYYDEGAPFYTDVADYSLRLTLPKDYAAVSTGGGNVVSELESKKVYAASCERVRNFAVALSDSYKTLQTVVGKNRIFYHYYADATPEDTLKIVAQAFDDYEKTFGGYPYGDYAVAETGLCIDYAAYTGVLFLSDALTGTERLTAVAEGVAKQWWGETVGSDPIENAWQSEGLATYSAACFLEKLSDFGIRRDDLVAEALREYRAYYDVYGSVLGRTDTRMTKHLSEFIGDYEYRCLARDKAVVMLDTLRKSVGDKSFFASLRRYYQRNLFSLADVGALLGAFEKSGVDARGFFDGFLNGKVIL